MKIINLSKETNEIQRITALRKSRNKRYHLKEFIIEGRTAIDEAYKYSWKIKSIYYDRERKLSEWANFYLLNKKAPIAYAITTELMKKISDREDTSELILIAETNVRGFFSYSPIIQELVVLLDQPKSSGNLGMVIRSAAAFGASAIVISGHAADEYDPKCIRSSVGTFFSIPIYRIPGVADFLKKIETLNKAKKEIMVIATGDKGDNNLSEIIFRGDILFLILGNETRGVSQGYRQAANVFARISTLDQYTSLNIGAAASIFLYEIFNKYVLTSKK